MTHRPLSMVAVVAALRVSAVSTSLMTGSCVPGLSRGRGLSCGRQAEGLAAARPRRDPVHLMSAWRYPALFASLRSLLLADLERTRNAATAQAGGAWRAAGAAIDGRAAGLEVDQQAATAQVIGRLGQLHMAEHRNQPPVEIIDGNVAARDFIAARHNDAAHG